MRTPDYADDTHHFKTLLEGFNGATLVSTADCYDFSLINYPIDTTILLDAPSLTSTTIGDTGVDYTLKL